ncbi:MAG: MarR family transcriptional regulator [Candidatus Competibacteraceae bacterium]
MTYKIGSIGEFMAWTKQVIRDPGVAEGLPKHWFDSEETALQSNTDVVAAEALVKLLSPDNLAVLQIINREKPESIRRLAELSGRKESNLSRTLKKLEKAGIIKFAAGPGRMRVPLLVASRVRLEIDLTGPASAVTFT